MNIQTLVVQCRQWAKEARLLLASLIWGSCPYCGNSNKSKIGKIINKQTGLVNKYCRSCHRDW